MGSGPNTKYSDELAEVLVATGTGKRAPADLGDFTTLETFVTDDDGNVASRIIYGAWGEELHTIDSVPNGLDTRFVGGLGVRNDSATGLIYMRYRWYDPGLQRFISRDPIGLAGGLNLYSYGSNSPVTFVDPGGLDPNITILGNQPLHVQNYLRGIGKRVGGPDGWQVYVGQTSAHSKVGQEILHGTPAVTSVVNGKITSYISLPSDFSSLKPKQQRLFLNYAMDLEANQADWFKRLQDEQNCPGQSPKASLDELYMQEMEAHVNTVGKFIEKGVSPDDMGAAFGGSRAREGQITRILMKAYRAQGPMGAAEAFQKIYPPDNFSF